MKPHEARGGLLCISERAANDLHRQQMLHRCRVEMQYAPATVAMANMLAASVAALIVAGVIAAEVQAYPPPLPASALACTVSCSAASRVACSCAAAANSRQPPRRKKAATAAELEAAAAAAAVVAASCGAAAVASTTSPAISSRRKKRRRSTGVGVVQCSQPRQPASSRSDSGKRGSRRASAAQPKHSGPSPVARPFPRPSAPTPTARLPPPPPPLPTLRTPPSPPHEAHAAAGGGAAPCPSAAREASPASKARTLEQPRAEVEAPPPGMSEVLGDPGRSLSAGRLEVLGDGAMTARHSARSCSSSSPLVRHATPHCSPLSARPEERAVSAPLLAAGAAGEAGVAGGAGGALSAAARTTLQLPPPLVAPGGRPDGGRPAWKCASHARSSSSEGGG